MDIVTTAEMIAREQAAFRLGISASALMETVGADMAGRIAANYPRHRACLVLVGKGNNGGDGLVVARHLAQQGRDVEVVLASPEDELVELPRAQLAQFRAAAPQVDVLPWSDAIVFPYSDGLVIDALLGLQARGPLRGDLAAIVTATNAARAARFFRTVALDIPSGLAAYEEGPAPGDPHAAIIADLTLTVGFAKRVLTREALAAWVGRIEVLRWSESPECNAPCQALEPRELASLLPRRGARSYKGDFGHVAIVAGSPGFTGAPVLCARGAQAIGAGLLSIVTHAEAAPIVAAKAPPEAMVSAWGNPDVTPSVVSHATVLIIGPGLGTSADAEKMLAAVLRIGCPVLVDADGLNLLAKNPALLKTAAGPVVLTPHVGEMARLIGRKFSADEREAVARAFADEHRVTLVLKGTRTLVTAPGAPLFVNTTGNPGLATGGSGDALAGMIGGLLAQKLTPLDAARLGVWLHGHAADLALRDRNAEEGLTPTILCDNLSQTLVSLRAEAAPRPGLLERSPA